jgi:hypothetical protein
MTDESSDTRAFEADVAPYNYLLVDWQPRTCPDCGGTGNVVLLITNRLCTRCKGAGEIVDAAPALDDDDHGTAGGVKPAGPMIFCNSDGSETIVSTAEDDDEPNRND